MTPGLSKLRRMRLTQPDAAVRALEHRSPIDPSEPLALLQPGANLLVRHGRGANVGPLYARQSLQQRLEAAAAYLPEGFALVVLDAWRSKEAQRALYKRLARQIDGTDPRLYAFDPDQSDTDLPYPSEDAPHVTGGAVDVGLLGPDGAPWPMGTDVDDMTAAAATNALEDAFADVPNGAEAVLGRRLLFWAMHAGGFSNYPREYWHYDFGNAFWRFFGHLGAGAVFREVELPRGAVGHRAPDT